MASLQDTLYEEFQQIQGAASASAQAWSGGGGNGGLGGAQADTAPRGDVDSLGDQTGTVDYGGSSKSSATSSSGGLLNDVEGVLTGGLGIVPLGLEIASIFGGGSSTPPPLTHYAMPDSIGFMGSTDDAGATGDADFGQTGQPRSYGTPSSQYTTTTVPAAGASAPPAGGSAGQTQSQPIQITVQAMDAQSFLDRSDDIAAAVNKAILSLHPVADTISNL
ncbi:MAG TPA: hypothetical protein VHW09_03220 [Bryobacteraceae bacterium]|jgi:hypothetical protein|nr:hypothetical protein [Bryobacteraceae bacterium]